MPTPPAPDRSTVAELLASAKGPLFSFEFFPPKDAPAMEQLLDTIAELEPLHPDFVSVTYGANGSTRDRTLRVSRRISEETTLRTVGHLTCVSQSRGELVEAIEAYASAGIKHILAIRGDPAGGPTAPWVRHPDGLDNATELVRLVRSIGNFCVGVAAFPDAHPEHRDFGLDARLLVEKAEAGAQFAITQLFFNPRSYFALVERVRALGCHLPIIPGIMPVTAASQIERFAELSGADLPAALVARLRAVADDATAVRAVGVEVATKLADELLRGGAPGLHFFTQNRSVATREIWSRLRDPRVGQAG